MEVSAKTQLRGILQNSGADRVFFNANVITMNPRQPRAGAVAVKNGRIIGVGSNQDIRQFCGPKTEKLDLEGKTVLPGFVESHIHMSLYAMTAPYVDLYYTHTDSIEDIQDRIRERADHTPKGTWIVGWGYDDARLAEKRHPNRWDLDKAAPDHPVYVHSFSVGHFGTVNSMGLHMAGISRDTPSPEGSEIVRDENGEPTGNLAKFAATALVISRLPSPTLDESIAGLQHCNEICLQAGVTSVHDAAVGVVNPLDLALIDQAISSGNVTVRVRAMLYFEQLEKLLEEGEDLSALGAGTNCGNDWLRVGPVKVLGGGSLPTQTAALSEPYLCDPANKGALPYTQERLNEIIFKFHQAGFQVAVHAIGDLEIEAVVVAFESALSKWPRDNHRHRIEHCKLATENQLERIARAGLNVSFYPAHTYYFGDGYRDVYLGPERSARLNPMKSALDLGINFGLHGDSPLTPISPLGHVSTAVVRETMGGDIQGPEQSISVTEALKAVTINAAHLAFEEHSKGSIENGKLADLAVLAEDPYQVAPREIRDIPVDLTIIDGEVVYRRDQAPFPGGSGA